MRGWFAFLSAAAPKVAEWHATRLFFTPQRRPGRGPGRIAGVEGAEFHVVVGGKQVACWSYGSGPMVLMVHGWGGCARDWEEMAARLVEGGRRVILFDALAHGVSEGKRTTLVEMARTIHAIADEVALGTEGRFETLDAVVAHSFGGAAAALAVRDGLLTRNLVLVAPVAEPMGFVDQVAEMLGLSAARRAGMVERIRIAAGGDLGRIDVVRAIAGCAIPGMVIHDSGDVRVPWSQGRAIAEAWPHSHLVTTTGLGHRDILRSGEVIERIARQIGIASPAVGRTLSVEQAPSIARTPPAPSDPARGRPAARETARR
ncbi:MAG TPA: alpha/beta hydrolase [Longimicrobium sp.]|nr:alpha/beta hydrolase [Longimicrobium sp.]